MKGRFLTIRHTCGYIIYVCILVYEHPHDVWSEWERERKIIDVSSFDLYTDLDVRMRLWCYPNHLQHTLWMFSVHEHSSQWQALSFSSMQNAISGSLKWSQHAAFLHQAPSFGIWSSQQSSPAQASLRSDAAKLTDELLARRPSQTFTQ